MNLSSCFAMIAPLFFAAPMTAQFTPPKPMPADAHPSFAVATIKPHNPTSQRTGFNAKGDRFSIQNETVANMLQFAFSVDKHQIVNAPDWVSQSSWDIDGTTDVSGEPNLQQLQEMVKKLLADRFGLVFHTDKRRQSVYAIRVAKGGVKLQPAAHPNARFDESGRTEDQGTLTSQVYISASMSDLILVMQLSSDRPIVDQSGLTGRFDFKLRYVNDEAHSSNPDAPPGLFTAIQEQLGLKLQPTIAPVDVLVIDRVNQPSAN
jgi:uncharacterized protein (TIGR03435 family)